MKTGCQLIAAERTRQLAAEGWTAEHDDTHTKGELSGMAVAYAATASANAGNPCGLTGARHAIKDFKPARWSLKPDTTIRNLVKAGALIAAEIDRLQRLQPTA